VGLAREKMMAGLTDTFGPHRTESHQNLSFPFVPPAFEYVDSLMQCYFKQADLDGFASPERFMTYTQLLGRLEERLTKREAVALVAAAGASGGPPWFSSGHWRRKRRRHLERCRRISSYRRWNVFA
jgi:hypothetical protein